MEIIPAILPHDFEEIREKLSRVMGVVDRVQIDLTDGIFVPSQTWPYNHADDRAYERIMAEEEGLPYWDQFHFELDLMVKDAKDNFDTFLKLGADRILFHLEAEDADAFFEFLEGIDPYVRENTEIGIAFSPSTPVASLARFIPLIDCVQCMGSDKLGMHGVALDERVYDIIRELRAKYPELPISVDIGVSLETAPRFKEAGATRLAAGSAIWKSPDIAETVRLFEAI